MSFRERILTLLLALAICPYFIDLGGSAIWDANEAFYVETPREMMERGDYVSPTFNYEPRLNKPVLSYWVVAGVYHLFGVSVGVQRLPIAIGATRHDRGGVRPRPGRRAGRHGRPRTHVAASRPRSGPPSAWRARRDC